MRIQDLIDMQAAQSPTPTADVPARLSRDKTLILHATLAGRCANGYERGAGRVVQSVQASPDEKMFGINHYARSLCGKTHGARSAGWSHDSSLAVTCVSSVSRLWPRGRLALFTRDAGDRAHCPRIHS